MTATNVAFQVVAPISMFLVVLPLPWHWSARNVGTLLYIAWSFTGSLVFFVNSIVWNGNLSNLAPVWCDISTKLMMGLNVAVPAVSLCINRRLYKIATMKKIASCPSEKRNEVIIDLSIGLGLPVLVMALHYVVQGHRYDIVENVGCTPSTYIVPLAVILVLMWPTLLGFVSMCYSVLSIVAFIGQRRNLNAVMNGHSQMNMSRYTRLIALAGTNIILDLPLSVFILWSNVRPGFHPWVSWSDTHYNFPPVDFIPAALLKQVPGAWAALEITRWGSPILGVIFFGFFGLAGECFTFYHGCLEKFLTFFGLKAFGASQISAYFTRSSFPTVCHSPNTPHPHRLHTQPSMIHIHVDTTCDADLENGTSVQNTKPIDVRAVNAEKLEFPNEQDITRDYASDASIELGGVYISQLSSPMVRFSVCDMV